MNLCPAEGCARERDHAGSHDPHPSRSWGFLAAKDKDKITKAGFATPRGGAKGAYQNHVLRSNKVIVPFERLSSAPLAKYENGYVVRLFPDQFFAAPGQPKPLFLSANSPKPGHDAFVLYRTHDQLAAYPPPANWRVRTLSLHGVPISERTAGAVDSGEYVLRIAAHGNRPARVDGPPQGIFAPEYANENANFLAKCILAWLTAHTVDSPYVATQTAHIEAILTKYGLYTPKDWEALGLLRSGFSSCPLCLKHIKYNELHDQIAFTEEASLLNAADQVINATRSTIVNLFHMVPLTYSDIEHVPQNVAWGHAICNTKLGQRRCYPIPQVIASGLKVGSIDANGVVSTFGWASKNLEMIRSPAGAVWIRIVDDHLSPDEQSILLEYLKMFEGG
jgi:hypothetical protein